MSVSYKPLWPSGCPWVRDMVLASRCMEGQITMARKAVLLVEDTPVPELVSVSALEGAGYEVEVARDAETGLQRARDVHWAAAVVDIRLPPRPGRSAVKLEGLRVIRGLKTDPATLRIPVLATSEVPDPKLEDACRAAGADDFLPRDPLDPVALVERVRALTRGRRNR